MIELFRSQNPAESHAFLADYLEKNPGSPAECRIDDVTGEIVVFDDNPLRVQEINISNSNSFVSSLKIPKITVEITGEEDIAAFEIWMKTRG